MVSVALVLANYHLTFGFNHIVQAQEYEITDLKPFFSSTEFSGVSFELDQERRVIRCPRRLITW